MGSMQSIQHVPATDLERETGLGKDLLRKWRERYGFPVQERSTNGTLGYSRDQVRQLRLIRRLLDAGLRPSQVVGKPFQKLEQLVWAFSKSTHQIQDPCVHDAIAHLKQHDLAGLTALLSMKRSCGSLTDFVVNTVAPLLEAIGDAWVQGDIEVYQEHLCSDIVIRCLLAEISKLKPQHGFPRVMLATPPEELHVLGLLMTEAVLADHGAYCISVGPQVAMEDLAVAAQACSADVVAISFSSAFPTRRVRPSIAHLRELLPMHIQIWVGGVGTAQIRRPPSEVVVFCNLLDAAKELLVRAKSLTH
jgi:methylmalonyl-CoA mutase cobalamin-binding subunit